MNWSKLAVIALILVILGSVSFFGAKMGYETNGEYATFKFNQAALPEIVAVKQFDWPGDEFVFMVTFDTGFQKLMPYDELNNYLLASGQKERGAGDFLKDLLTFNIHDMPDFISYIFIILLVLLGVIIVTTFVPFMTSGE